MVLHILDWVVLLTFLLITLGIGLYFTKEAGQNINNFFLGGRKMSWWMAGISMAATTFAADTPLLIAELVGLNGISGNWIWWNAAIGGMLTTFLFAKLWRRANILTDVELVNIRYSGKSVHFLRGFKAIYVGVLMNGFIIAWVNLALMTLLKEFMGIDEPYLIPMVALTMLFVAIYSSLSGLIGVIVTDFVQFIIAMLGTIILAILVVNSEKIGGIAGLKAKLPETAFNFYPFIDFGYVNPASQGWTQFAQVYTISLATFLSFVGFQWWASWYPGAEPGGGGYIAQRMMSVKNENDALKAALLFQIIHYCVRPWAWILVGLCAVILYPELGANEKRIGYVWAMRDFLPLGWRGLLIAAFFSAYMSTISTQLNWGVSYLINDFYKPFIHPQADDKKMISAARIATFLLMGISLLITNQLFTFKQSFEFLLETGAGLGAVLILRWYWWRINVWSEISATLAPFLAYPLAHFYFQLALPYSFFFTVGFTTITWLSITYLTHPTDWTQLESFYLRVKPEGFWQPIRLRLELPKVEKSILPDLIEKWLFGIGLIYSTLFFIGELIFMNWSAAAIYLVVLIISLYVVLRP